MTPSQITYNPGILGDEDLVRSFVVRHESLELILEALRENAASPAANRHLLMIGPRGIGKTMLVRRAAAAIRSSLELSSNWYPLVFGEESYPVSTPGEFWLEALFHLADETGEPGFRKALEELRGEHDDSRLRERALSQLLDFADREKKRVLLVVENLNTLVAEQMDHDSAWEVRHTLLQERRLMLLGTATNRFDEIENSGHAWFEMFSVHQLQPLDVDDCGALWRFVTGTPIEQSPLKAIRILTGGNPRLVALLAGFAANHSFRQLMEQLVHLIDDHTEYFKGHLDSLAVKERKVFVAVLERWDPVGAAEIAQQTRLTVNEVSSLLARLCGRGAVEVAIQKGRKKLYQASERLYNIYYLMRRRGHPEGRVQAAVQFMVTFYGREELVSRLADLAREACELPEDVRKDHYYVYREVLRRIPRIIPRVIECTRSEFFKPVDAKSAREAGASGLIREGYLLSADMRFQEAEKLFRRAIEFDERNSEAWSGLARVFLHHESWKDAEEAFDHALKLDPSEAENWHGLGHACFMQGRLLEAEKADRMAIQLAPNGQHWNNLATVLWHLKRFPEAEQAYRQAIQLEPDNPDFWRHLGHLLIEAGPPDEAEKLWTQALKLHGEKLAPCAAHLLDYHRARGVSAETIVQEARHWISQGKNSPSVLAAMAKFIVRARLGEGLGMAEEWAREAFKKRRDPYTAEALLLVLSDMQKWPDVVTYCKDALDASADQLRTEIYNPLFIRAAAAGWARQLLDGIKASKAAIPLEPLTVGLQIYLGEAPVVAKEILEVGRDVADSIHATARSQS